MKNLRIIWFILLIVCCAGSVLAQETSKVQDQCKISATREFYGGKVTIVEKIDVRGILNIISKTHGCKFVVDESVSQVK
jgi:hypothetical protein